MSFFCVADTERLKYVQNYGIKWKKVRKIKDRHVDKLERVRHV
jgi:hypothetical protein